MASAEDKIVLYHGSYTAVTIIDLTKCRPGKDFGQGFYLTASKAQAESFVRLSVKNAINAGMISENRHHGFLTSFQWDRTVGLQVHDFPDADKEWLHYICSNRRTNLFSTIRKYYANFDIISGKIANDRTATTLQLYLSGAYGTPGDETADSIAISLLLPNRLQKQYCFKTQKAIDSLTHIASIRHEFTD